MITEDKINEIVNKIITNYDPDKIVLFGSYSQGNPTENSDLDLLIIKDSDIPRHRRGREVRRFLYGLMVPIDLIVYTKTEIEESKDVKFSFIHNILNTGKILYAK